MPVVRLLSLRKAGGSLIWDLSASAIVWLCIFIYATCQRGHNLFVDSDEGRTKAAVLRASFVAFVRNISCCFKPCLYKYKNTKAFKWSTPESCVRCARQPDCVCFFIYTLTDIETYTAPVLPSQRKIHHPLVVAKVQVCLPAIVQPELIRKEHILFLHYVFVLFLNLQNCFITYATYAIDSSTPSSTSQVAHKPANRRCKNN